MTIFAVYKLVSSTMKDQTFQLRNYELRTRNNKRGTRNAF